MSAKTINAHSEETNSFGVGLSILSFRYAEYPNDSRLNNKETGFLPGLNAAIRFSPGAWRIGLSGSAHGGKVDYEGATSSLRAYQTQTETTIFDATVIFGRAFESSESVTLTPYLGAGYRYWRRDIQPNNGVLGLLETYRWFYGALGVEATWKKSDRLSFGVDVRAIRPFNAQLDVEISPATTLDLAARTGYRFGLPVHWSFGGKFGLSIEPYYERQEWGASAPKNGILEPASASDIFGVHLSGRFAF